MLHVTKSKQLLGLRELGRLGFKASLVAGQSASRRRIERARVSSRRTNWFGQ